MIGPTKPNEVRFDLGRSQRVHAQLPVVVQGKSTDDAAFAVPTRAIILSAHGCLVTLSKSVRLVKNSSCETSSTMRSKIAESCT
jgi:hypothetical protein